MKGNRCMLCNSKSYSILIDNLYAMGKSHKIAKCSKCGLVFLFPKPLEKELNKLYSKKYYESKSGFPLVEKFYTRLVRNLKVQAINTNIIKENARVLDIGCGTGDFLACFKRKGHKCYGLDTSKTAFKLAKAKLGQNIFNCKLGECHFSSGSFDVILLSHVIEHFSNPNEELKEIYRVLKDDGTLFISTPNIDSFEFKIAKEEWYGLSIPLHLYLYSPKTIAMLLKKNGFRIINISYPFLSFPLGLFRSSKKKILDNRSKLLKPVLLLPLLFSSIMVRLVFFNYRGTMEVVCKKETSRRCN